MSTTLLKRLLGDVPEREFIDNFFLQQPFSKPGGCGPFNDLGSWDTVRRVLNDDGVDFLLARGGELCAELPPPSFDRIRQLHGEGYTLGIRNAQRHDPGLADLAEGFARDFHAPVNIHLYCTPPSQHGFGWHYDAEDVFILQTRGEKEYSLRKNTVNPWPTVETIPPDMRFDREIMPVMKCRLQAGDWLYIPAGYWHVGQSSEAAISLAVGLMTPTALEVFDFLRGGLLDSLLWRQRLPVSGDAATLGEDALLERYCEILAELTADLQRRLGDPKLVREFLCCLRPPTRSETNA